MPLNGAGSYTPPAPAFPAISGTLVEAAKFNEIINDIASALSTAYYRDGQAPASSNLSMAGFRLTNTGAPVASGDAVNLNYLVNYVRSQFALGSVYLGSSTTDPTERPDGTALEAGDIYLNISNPAMPYFRGFSGTDWVEGIPGDVATINYTPPFSGAVPTTTDWKFRQEVCVLDFMTDAEKEDVLSRTGALDVSDAIHTAYGGEGTAVDNRSVFFPDGVYNTGGTVIKIYRAGEELRNVAMIGQSSDGVFFTSSTPSKGIVFGEPSISDGLWGNNSATPSLATYTRDIEVRNISHKYDDLGLWFVYCKNIIADNIKGSDLVCLAAGNDAADDCFNLQISNVTRMNDGRNVAPDAWYSIGLYRVTGFSIHKFHSEFLPAAEGTGGTHIVAAASSKGIISNCVINQSVVSGNGITLEEDTHDVIVALNTVNGVVGGIITFGVLNEDNLIGLNTINGCTDGIRPLGRNSTFALNVIRNSSNKDIYSNSTDGINNKFFANDADTFEFPPSVEGLQYFTANPNVKQQLFVPSVEFKQILPAGVQETHDSTNYRITNAAGSIRLLANLSTGGRTGFISNVRFIFNRLISATSINCYTVSFNNGGTSANNGEVLDTTTGTGIREATVVFTSGTTIPVTNGIAQYALFIPTDAALAELIGVVFDFQETGVNLIVST